MRLELSLLPDPEANQRRQYLLGLTLVAVVTLFCHTFSSSIAQENLVLLFLVSVILAALYLGEGPTVMVAILSFLMLDFGVLNAFLETTHFDEQYVTSLGIFLFVGFVISNLANRLRRQAHEAQEQESNSRALYELSKELMSQTDKFEMARRFERHLSQAYDLDVNVYLRDAYSTQGLEPEDRDALRKTLESPSTSRATRLAEFFPLVTARGVAGAVRLAPRQGSSARGPVRDDASRLLFQSFCSQVALTLDQVDISEQVRQAEVSAQTERLQSALLNSISHDLQTPLASISGSLQLLASPERRPDPESQKMLLHLAADQTERLRRLVTNLLEVTRLEGGGLRLNLQTLDADEVLDLVVNQAPQVWKERLQIHRPESYLEFEVDGVLWLSVLLNLLENAAKYSPAQHPVELQVVAREDATDFQVLDRGDGVPDDAKERIFERFFRLDEHLRAVGSGLGLYVSKGIVEAHGGRLWVEDRPGGGSLFTARIPKLSAQARSSTRV